MAYVDDRVELEAGEGSERGSGGTKAISRAITVLRLVARGKAEGVRITTLARTAGIPYSTLHRIVHCLCEEGMIRRNPDSGCYQLGNLSSELGLASPMSFDFRDALRPRLERIAEETGERAFLMARSGSESVCLDMVRGSRDDRAVSFGVGARRPICYVASGMAFLSQLGQTEASAVIRTNLKDIRNHASLTVERVVTALERARERGYGVARDVSVLGLSSVAVFLPPSPAHPALSVSLGMKSEHLTARRAEELAEIMGRELSLVA
jgi:DNA-binding IclR family transcriptional regulator